MKKIGLEKRDKITLAEHLELSRELRETSQRLHTLWLVLYNKGYRAYGVKSAYMAYRKIRILISDLDDILASEYPKDFNSEIYYPSENRGNENGKTN